MSATSSPHDINPVGIWVRVSTQEQAKGESPEHHQKRAEMYAELKGWHAVRVYDLSGVSGKSVVNHPECKAMLADVAAGRIKGLIFSKLARFARNTRELLDFAEYFKEYDADLVSLDESIDTSTPAGRFFYTLIAAMAQWEREEIVERIMASIEIRAKLGKSLGGPAPFGYRKEDGMLVLDEDEAPVRKRMFEVFLETKRLKTTARQLNEEGYRTRRGAKFTHTTVERLLTDPIAKGKRRANYTRRNDTKGWTLKPESEWIYTDAPAVVSVEVWDECNAIIKKHKNKSHTPSRGTKYLFSGLTYCHCGGKMYKPTQLKKYDCNKCHNKIPEVDLEKIFVEQLRAFFVNEEEIARQFEKTNGHLSGKEELLASTKRDLDELAEQMDKTYKLYLSDTLDEEAFGKLYRPLNARHQELSDQIPRLQAELDVAKIDSSAALQIVSEARHLYDYWDNLTFDERRTIVETIVERIEIGDSTVDISLAYVPHSSATLVASVNPSLTRKGSSSLLPSKGVHKGERMGMGSSTPPA